MDDNSQNLLTTREKASRRIFKYLILLLVFFGLSVGCLLILYLLTPAEPQTSTKVTVVIPEGSSVRQIAQVLDDAHLVRGDIRFLLTARITGLASRLPAGEFELTTSQRPLALLRELASAKPLLHTITIPEGWNRFQIADWLEENDWCTREDFLQATEDPVFLEKVGDKDSDSLEGYLFPDTYKLTRSQFQVDTIVNIFLERFLQVWQEISKDAVSDIDMHDTVTLASIVEKETGTAEERTKIAGVFSNRLRDGMRLQSDPTVIYGIEDFSGPITKTQLKTVTPYNTYLIDGLPKGPICSPGRSALLAVLKPDDHKYLYFVSQNDGTHYFSTSLQEHNLAVQKYQRNKTDKESK